MTQHVLVLINALGEGGTERSMAELIPRMEAHGFRFTLATLRSRGDEGVEPSLRAQGYEITRLEGGLIEQVRAYRGLLASTQPDLVHSMLYEANLVARLGSVGSSAPVLTSLVNTSYSAERMATPGMSRATVRAVQVLDVATGLLFVNRFHAVSESVADDAERHLLVRPKKMRVVPRGRVDPRPTLDHDVRAKIRSELGVPLDDHLVVNVGRHEYQKDHRTLVRAMAPLLEKRSNVWLAVAGRDGSETESLHVELGLVPNPDRVLLLGHRSDVPAVLAASDLFVMTSRYEGMPGAVIEAMGVGLPVVASDIGPVREVVSVGATALVASVGSVGEFGSAIGRLLDDKARREQMGEAGRQLFERRFTIDASAAAMAQMYTETIGARPRRR